MKKFMNMKGALKFLSVLLVAGVIMTGVSVSPRADDFDGDGISDEQNPEYLAWAALNGDVYFDGNQNGLDDDYEAAKAEAERIAAEQAAAKAEAERKAAEEAAAAKAEAERIAAEQAAAKAEAERIAAEQAAAAKAEAERKAAEEAAKLAARQPRQTPNVGKDLYNQHKFTNLPDNCVITIPAVGTFTPPAGDFTLDNNQYEALSLYVKNNVVAVVSVVAKAHNEDELDSAEQKLNVGSTDFPARQKQKMPTPSASFEASTSLLYNLGSCAKYSVDGGSTWSVDITGGSTSINGVHPDLEILVMNPALTEDQTDSDIQTIWIRKADKPQGAVGNPATAIGGTGSLAHVSADEEYCVSGTNNWIAIGGSTVDGLKPGDYDIRVKAHGTLLASDIVTVTIEECTSKKEDKPNASFDGASLNLYPISVGMAYTLDGSNWVTITDNAATHVTFTRDQIEKAVHGNGIQIKKLGNGKTTTDSDIQQILVTEASKPVNVTTTPATNGNNGSICNVAADMQYSTNGTSWIDIGSNTVNGLAKGTYYVRRKAAGAMIASEYVSVTIGTSAAPKAKENMPSATFNAWNMTLSDCKGCQVSYDGGNNYTDSFDRNDVVLDENKIRTDKGLYVRRAGTKDTAASDAQHISLSKQAMPSGISAVSATAKSLGMITGVNSMMEYRAANSGTWAVPAGNTIANLPAGTYYIRTKGAHTAMPSDYVAVVIQTTATQTVVQPTTTPQIVVSPASEDNKKEAKKDTKDTGKKNDSTITVDKSKVEEAEKEAAAAEESAAKAEEAAANAQAAAQEAQAELNEEPVLLADANVKGWGAIEGQMSSDKTEPMAIDLTHSKTVVPATTIAAAATTNTELILDISPDMAWSIQPSQIQRATQDVDLGIKENTSDIPAERLATVQTEGVVEKQFSINHEGDFGFTANLTVKLNAADAGKTAKLFWYNKESGNMELVDYAVINEYGEATFAMTHASSYAVCVNTASTVASNSSNTTTSQATTDSVKDTKKSSALWIWIVVAVIVLVAAIVAVLILKKKQEEEARRRRHMQQNHPNGLHHSGDVHHTNDSHHNK